jgi:hypothetical protein
LRKDPTNLKVRRTHYLEEHPLNKTNQNFLPLFMQNETLQNRHNPINPFQLFVFKDYQSPGTFDIKPNPVGPIMTSIPMAQTQIVADKAKEYGMNKPTPFTGDQTKIRQFLQDCLGYLDMNQSIYNTDWLKIGFILSYINDGKAANWKEYYLDTLEDPNTGMPNFLTLVMFLADVQKAFWATDRVRDVVNRLEMLRQGKKTAEELNTEFLQIFGQAGMDRRTPSDHLHLIGYYWSFSVHSCLSDDL